MKLYIIYLGCGGRLLGSQGNFSSPNYPSPSPPHTECEWVISLPKDGTIHLTIHDIDIEKEDEECLYDYLDVRYLSFC